MVSLTQAQQAAKDAQRAQADWKQVIFAALAEDAEREERHRRRIRAYREVGFAVSLVTYTLAAVWIVRHW